MKFTFISRNGDILPLAQRVESEGNQVTFYVVGDEELLNDKRIIDDGPDVIVIDSPGFGRISAKLKKLGFPVLGGSLFSDTISNDIKYHNTFLKACGLYSNGVGRIQNAIPIDIEGWFTGKDFSAVIYTLNSISFPGFKEDKLYKECLLPILKALKKSGHIGPVSIKSFINSNSIQFETVRVHFSTPTLLTLMEGIKSNVSNVLSGMSSGSNRWIMFKPGYFIGIQLILNPQALLEPNKYYDSHVYGLSEENLKHMWVYGLKKNGDGYVYNGNDGRFGVVTARGDSISEARRRANRTIEGKVVMEEGRKKIVGGIRVDGLLYLKGIGNKADFQHSRLKDWGWL